jgi:hypothetical protein
MKDALSSKTRGSARLLPESAGPAARESGCERAHARRARSRSPETLHALTGPAARESACCTPRGHARGAPARGHARGAPARPRACSPRSGQHVQVSSLSVSSVTPSCGPQPGSRSRGCATASCVPYLVAFRQKNGASAPAFYHSNHDFFAVRNSSVFAEHLPKFRRTRRTQHLGPDPGSEVARHRARRPRQQFGGSRKLPSPWQLEQQWSAYVNACEPAPRRCAPVGPCALPAPNAHISVL